MTNEMYLALQDARRREFIDWLFELVNKELDIKPVPLARALNMDPRTLDRLKKGDAAESPMSWKSR